MIYHSKKSEDECDAYRLDDLAAEVRCTALDLKEHLDEFDVIAVTGLSGILPGVGISLKLKAPLAILRKPYDNTHQSSGPCYVTDGSRWVGAESITDGSRVLWLDDFECSGDTGKRIRNAVQELGGRVVAQYLTRDRSYERLV